MTTASDRLYNLLPVTYRLRDAAQGAPLRSLLAVISDELAEVEADIRGLYENWFVETSDEWVIPYIGDLLGVRGLNTLENASFSQRSYVANTLYYRRRKGTARVLETLATDVTGWSARAVEFFELLQTTQYLNHLRLFNIMPDLRDTNRLNLLNTPFDSLPHSADVRHIDNRRGRHNIRNLGIFLWRLQNYQARIVTPSQAQAPHTYGYHFSPLGNPAPLFNAPSEIGGPEGIPNFGGEQLVPAPIRLLDFRLDLEAFQKKYALDPNPPLNSRYYGPMRSLQIVKDGVGIPPLQVTCKDLRDWGQPATGTVAVDVVRGRLSFAAGKEPAVSLTVSYNYGFSADLGGGPYDRRARLAETALPVIEFPVKTGTSQDTLAKALLAWQNGGYPPAVIRIHDSATYDAGVTVNLPANGSLVIDCESETRPSLVNASPLRAISAASDATQTPSLTLSGLLIEGSLNLKGKINLTITDCTLVPGLSLDEDGFPVSPAAASLTIDGTDVTDTLISITRSITGPLELPEELRSLSMQDSILDAPLAAGADEPYRAALAANASGSDPGPVTTLERVTVFGEVHVKQLDLASEVIFVHPVTADRRQVGCVRFSSVPGGSQTPRQFRCQPGLAIEERKKALAPVLLSPAEEDEIKQRLRPQFTSSKYGEPAFSQLATACADGIKTGAENGAEMGAFCLLQQPQRLANLQVALDEYLRFGLEAGIFLVT